MENFWYIQHLAIAFPLHSPHPNIFIYFIFIPKTLPIEFCEFVSMVLIRIVCVSVCWFLRVRNKFKSHSVEEEFKLN